MRRLSMINEGLMMQFQKCTVAKAHIRPSLALYGQENSSKPSNYVLLLYYCYFSIFEFIHNLLMSVSSWVFTGRTPFCLPGVFLVLLSRAIALLDGDGLSGGNNLPSM